MLYFLFTDIVGFFVGTGQLKTHDFNDRRELVQGMANVVFWKIVWNVIHVYCERFLGPARNNYLKTRC